MNFSHTPEYLAYLLSDTWRRKRQRKFKQVGRKCELCGSVRQLEVHHLHYDSLGKEKLADLQVLCVTCHPIADEERRKMVAARTYMRKVYGEFWHDEFEDDDALEYFEVWLSAKHMNHD
jgi:5-methylcytosine-specific restriction endonuclease McrA